MQKNINSILPKDVAEKFKIVKWTGGHIQAFGRFGVIDLSKITLDHANSLSRRGFPKIVAKSTKSVSKTEGNNK